MAVVEIATLEELQAVRHSLSAHYVLVNDIDARDTENWNGGEGFEPIGTLADRFLGTFDGQGYSVLDLWINRPTQDHVGLFGYIGLTDDTPEHGAELTVFDLSVTGQVQGNNRVGLLAGTVNQAARRFARCHTRGTVQGQTDVGGMFGGHFRAWVEDCCSVAGVFGTLSVGGLIGLRSGPGGSLVHCYAAGPVAGSAAAGGLTGAFASTAPNPAQDCYWDTQASGQSTSMDGAGRSTAQMRSPATFAGWNPDVWLLWGGSYPALRGLAETYTADLAVAHDGSPYLSGYRFKDGRGFGVRYANPDTLPTGRGADVGLTSTVQTVALAHANVPYISAYQFASGQGYTGRYANPATLPRAEGLGVAIDPSDQTMAVPHWDTPRLITYPFSEDSGFGAAYADPDPSLATKGVVRQAVFSRSGQSLIAVHTLTPYMSGYAFSPSIGYGPRYADPVQPVPNETTGIALNPEGTLLVIGHFTSPRLSVYPFTDGHGFGTRYASDPPVAPQGTVQRPGFHPSGNAIVTGYTNTPYLIVYPFSPQTGFGAQDAHPATPAGGTCHDTVFSLSGDSLVAAHGQSAPWMAGYAFELGTGFGAKYADPDIALNQDGRALTFGDFPPPLPPDPPVFLAAWAFSANVLLGA